MRHKNNGGWSLMELIIGAAILGLIFTGIANLQLDYLSAQRHTMKQDDMASLRQKIATYVDCEATLDSQGLDINNIGPGECDSTSASSSNQVAPFLWLQKRHKDGSFSPMTDAPTVDGTAKMGDWLIRTTCSQSENSLVVRGAPDHPGVDFDSESKLFFGGGTDSLPLCFQPSENLEPKITIRGYQPNPENRLAAAVRNLGWRITYADTINVSALYGSDALMIEGPNFPPLSPAEISAIKEFVQNGNGLLVTWDYDSDPSLNNANLLANEFGVTLNNDSAAPLDMADVTVAHPVTNGLTEFNFRAGGSLSTVPPAQAIATARGTYLQVLAVSTLGTGRAVFHGDRTFVYPYGPNYPLEEQLYLNMAHWIAGQAPPPIVP